jgi:hypothetical protein
LGVAAATAGRDLPQRIYLLAAGPLRAIPFDALRLDGHYLAEHRGQPCLARSLNVDSHPGTVTATACRGGNPQNQLDPFRFEIRRSAEIGAVTDRFVGPACTW